MEQFWNGFEKRAVIVITKKETPSSYKTDHRVVGGIGGSVLGTQLGMVALSKLEKTHPHMFGNKKGLAALASMGLAGGALGWKAGKKDKHTSLDIKVVRERKKERSL